MHKTTLSQHIQQLSLYHILSSSMSDFTLSLSLFLCLFVCLSLFIWPQSVVNFCKSLCDAVSPCKRVFTCLLLSKRSWNLFWLNHLTYSFSINSQISQTIYNKLFWICCSQIVTPASIPNFQSSPITSISSNRRGYVN